MNDAIKSLIALRDETDTSMVRELVLVANGGYRAPERRAQAIQLCANYALISGRLSAMIRNRMADEKARRKNAEHVPAALRKPQNYPLGSPQNPDVDPSPEGDPA